TVTGNTATFSVTVPGGPPGPGSVSMGTTTCTVTLDGDTLSGQCQVPMGTMMQTCDAAGGRARVAGASRLCCDVGAEDCGEGQRCGVVSAVLPSPPASVGRGPFDQPQPVTACLSAGELAEGDACTQDDGTPGADQCGAG